MGEMWWPVVWYHSCSIGQSTYYLCGQRLMIAGHRTAFHRCRKQFHFGGPNVIYTAIAVICAACMNINKVSRVKILGGPCPLGSYAYAFVMLLIFLAFHSLLPHFTFCVDLTALITGDLLEHAFQPTLFQKLFRTLF